MVKDKNDLVYGIIMDICHTCSYTDNKDYTTTVERILEGWKDTSNRSLWRIN